MNADVAKQKLTRAGTTSLDNRLILGAANVHLRTRKRFRERRPNALVVRTHHQGRALVAVARGMANTSRYT